MTDILCLGEPMVELNQQSDGSYLPGHGGDTSNCAIAAARQGASVGYFTRIGDDAFGQSFLDLWTAEGVDVSDIIVSAEAHTAVYFVTHGEEGHQFSYLRAGSAASQMSPGDLPEGSLRAAKILHVSAISQAISESAADTVFAAIDMARSAGVMVSYDTNLRTNLWPLNRARAIIHAAMSGCDIALPGYDDAVHLTGKSEPDDMVDFYLGLGARIVALTLGHRGTLVATADERRRVQAMPVEAVDATGAGDMFDGAFLAEYLATQDPFRAAQYANAAAALSTQGFGAVAPMPQRTNVEAFLAKNRQ